MGPKEHFKCCRHFCIACREILEGVKRRALYCPAWERGWTIKRLKNGRLLEFWNKLQSVSILWDVLLNKLLFATPLRGHVTGSRGLIQRVLTLIPFHKNKFRSGASFVITGIHSSSLFSHWIHLAVANYDGTLYHCPKLSFDSGLSNSKVPLVSVERYPIPPDFFSEHLCHLKSLTFEIPVPGW